MTRLRQALDGIAAEAPLVNLADAAIARHRRRRLVTTSLATVALAGVMGAGGVVMATPWRPAAEPAVQVAPTAPTAPTVPTVPAVDRAAVVADLPEGPVGRLSHAYQATCETGCDDAEWRVVTSDGKTYRVPRALARTAGRPAVPVAISRSGRALAYYSREAQAHVVRDMETGAEVVSPVKVPEAEIPRGAMLLVSDDGRYVAFDDPQEFGDYPGVLIDTRTGERTMLKRDFEPVAIKDGVLELVRPVKTDLWLMPVTGGGEPVRFDGVFVRFSEVAPDGRTVVALDMTGTPKQEPVLTVLDAKTGKALRKVPAPALAVDLMPTVWLSDTEVTVRNGAPGGRLYAVDITTGKARPLADHGEVLHLTLPGRATSS
ncbi:hypothetical protein [Nonomuraea sp. SBT364]|uniref:hypothetical protein n=1 Tax=Nonomuraea sp. SBT364 TaxID=1580530 RepID=UPI00066E8A5B|nr:hypothetical protein [Nonomuraea sp. SBT364]